MKIYVKVLWKLQRGQRWLLIVQVSTGCDALSACGSWLYISGGRRGCLQWGFMWCSIYAGHSYQHPSHSNRFCVGGRKANCCVLWVDFTRTHQELSLPEIPYEWQRCLPPWISHSSGLMAVEGREPCDQWCPELEQIRRVAENWNKMLWLTSSCP